MAMTDGEAEIEFLERIYGGDMHYDSELNRLAKNNVADMIRAAESAGRDDLAGLACYFCGVSASQTKLERCSCSFPEAFGCGIRGRRICANCEQAHKKVATHLETIFSLPFVNRVNSRRLQRWREFSRAVLALYSENAEVGQRPLYTEIAQCEEWDPETFRRDLLRCFAKASFLDFVSLAKNLKEQETESLLRAVIRSGLYR